MKNFLLIVCLLIAYSLGFAQGFEGIIVYKSESNKKSEISLEIVYFGTDKYRSNNLNVSSKIPKSLENSGYQQKGLRFLPSLYDFESYKRYFYVNNTLSDDDISGNCAVVIGNQLQNDHTDTILGFDSLFYNEVLCGGSAWKEKRISYYSEKLKFNNTKNDIPYGLLVDPVTNSIALKVEQYHEVNFEFENGKDASKNQMIKEAILIIPCEIPDYVFEVEDLKNINNILSFPELLKRTEQ